MHPLFGFSAQLLALLMATENANADIPDWARNNTSKLNGKIFTTVCHGSGPSSQQAKKSALHDCIESAKDQLTTEIRIRSVSISTEKSSAYHQEITENHALAGLNCDPETDQLEERENTYTYWVKCRFDLGKVNIDSTANTQRDPVDTDNTGLTKIASSPPIKSGRKFSSDRKMLLSIAVVPMCESLLIQGVKSRVVSCISNPMLININSDDELIIVRSKNHLPKKINLRGMEGRNANIEVILDPI